MDEGRIRLRPHPMVNSLWQGTKTRFVYIIKHLKEWINLMSSPSRGITVMGFFPIVGNFVNFGMAVRAYMHGETWHGHQKILETVVGTSLDIAAIGSIKLGWQRTHVGMMSSANLSCFCAGTQILISDLVQTHSCQIWRSLLRAWHHESTLPEILIILCLIFFFKFY